MPGWVSWIACKFFVLKDNGSNISVKVFANAGDAENPEIEPLENYSVDWDSICPCEDDKTTYANGIEYINSMTKLEEKEGYREALMLFYPALCVYFL